MILNEVNRENEKHQKRSDIEIGQKSRKFGFY